MLTTLAPLLQARPAERGGAMAAIAMDAELPQVSVIIAMAGDAVRGSVPSAARGLPVALRAGELPMRTRQREVRLRIVIELPDRPAIG
jgi:hypothetical protein